MDTENEESWGKAGRAHARDAQGKKMLGLLYQNSEGEQDAVHIKYV